MSTATPTPSKKNKASFLKTGSKLVLMSTATCMLGMALPTSAQEATTTPSNSWDYDTVLDGNVGKDVSVEGVTDITVDGGNGYVEGNADIYEGHTVNVTGVNGAETFAYRDNRDNIESSLDGRLNSNLQIVVIDKDGVFFTENSVVDVQGLLATTGEISVDDIMDADGSLSISDFGDGAVANFGKIDVENDAVFAANLVANGGKIVVADNGGRVLLASAEQIELARVGSGTTEIDVAENGLAINLGTINAGEAGLAALVAPAAINAGVINAKMGTVAMASGDQVTIDMFGDGLVEIGVDGAIENAFLANEGKIIASGGHVQITAQAAKDTLGTVVNNNGVIDASHATVEGGTIILSAGPLGDVRNGGRVTTSEGGSITVEAKNFVQEAVEDIPVIMAQQNGVEQSEAQVAAFIPVPGVKPTQFPMLSSQGGDITVDASGNVEILDGAIKAAGGDINIDNDGVFFSAGKSTLQTEGMGTISVNQNQPELMIDLDIDEEEQDVEFITAQGIFPIPSSFGTIQNAVDAISNTGSGTNTVTVGAGTYNETVNVGKDNVILQGANAGLHGRAPTRGAETIIQRAGMTPGVSITGDNVTVDGFTINEGAVGVRVQGGDNATIENNVITGQDHPSAQGTSFAGFATGDGVFVQNSTGTSVNRNHIVEVQDDGIHAVDVVDFTAFNNVINGADGVGDQGIAISGATGTTTVANNTITRARRDAIQLINVTGENSVTQNQIFFAGRSGINLVNTDGTAVDGNRVNFTDLGLDIFQTDNVTADGNTIRGASDGILLQASEDALFTNNEIFETEEGVVIGNSTRVTFDGNFIDATENGVRYKDGVSDLHRSTLKNNGIFAGENGVLIDGDMTGGAAINVGSGNTGNFIGAGNTGVKVDGTITGARLLVNGSIVYADQDAININAVGNDGVAAIWFNEDIYGINGNGVTIGSVDAGIDAGVTIAGNKIVEGGDAGVTIGNVNNSTIAIVENNEIIGGQDGISFDGSVTDSFVLIGEQDTFDESVIEGANGNGIEFNGNILNSQILIGAGGTATTASVAASSSYTTFTQDGATIIGGTSGISIGNTLSIVSFESTEDIDEGPQVQGIEGSVISISNNDIQGGGSGVSIAAEIGSETLIDIKDNKNISGEFIGVDVFDFDDTFFIPSPEEQTDEFVLLDGETVNIENNVINGAFLDVAVGNVENVIINNNEMKNDNQFINIGVFDSQNIEITNNDINVNGSAGVEIFGSRTESVIFQGNTITFPENEEQNKEIESFSIANAIGAFFAAGAVDFGDETNANTFINESSTPKVGVVFVNEGSPVFDEESEQPAFVLSSGPTIVNETLGSTIFEGFEGDGNFYVRFENGAILNPLTGDPIVIDAQNVSFDGRVAVDGLSPEQFEFIEERLFDADDAPVDGRGQIFEQDPNIVPFEPQGAGVEVENFEDFIPAETEEEEQEQQSASITIQGLPLTGIDGEAANNLNPEAGDGSNVAGIEPAAGGNAEEGEGRDVTCLSDAVGAIGGGSFTYSFGGSFEQSIAGQSKCAG